MDISFKFGLWLLLGIVVPVSLLFVPLYLKHSKFAPTHIPVISTDMREVQNGISTVWCTEHDIMTNHSAFSAYLLPNEPMLSNDTKTFQTVKRINLREYEREYWGFYLPVGSQIIVETCARHEGVQFSILRGYGNLLHCAKSKQESIESSEETHSSELGAGSSVSSSEERFVSSCRNSELNRTLTSHLSCREWHWSTKDIVNYTVRATDYYYIVFMTEQTILPTTVFARFTLLKTLFDLSPATAVCENTTRCHFNYSFASNQRVIFEINEEWIGSGNQTNSSWVDDIMVSTCKPRTALYFPFYLGIPLAILFFGFKGD